MQHGFGHGFPRKTAQILFWKLAWICRGFLSPFFPFPKIHAKSTPPKIPKSTWKHFSQWFLWVLDPVCVAVFRCQYFLCRATKSCKQTISALGTSSGTTTEHRFNDFDFQGKNPRQIPSMLFCSPKGLRAFFRPLLTPVSTTPFFASVSVHGLHFTVYAPSKNVLSGTKLLRKCLPENYFSSFLSGFAPSKSAGKNGFWAELHCYK